VSNRYYANGPERAQRVRQLFSAIAARYDLINDLQSFGLHRYWKSRLVNLALEDTTPAGHALDVCCGTGDVAFALGGNGLAVAGLDFSHEMLAVARRRMACMPRANGELSVEFVRGDAQNLPFTDESFDVVTISYGLRNLAEIETGLREMWRVTRRGGRVLVLDFGKPELAVWRAIYFGYLRWFVPRLGRYFCGDSETHSYILESLLHYGAQKGVASGMRKLGFSDIRVMNLMGGIMSIHSGRKE